VDAVARRFSGFYFGRFDVRSESVEQLQRGWFAVLELNGVSAEATHIYDPSVSLLEAYRALFRQWRVAFEIGVQNRQLGYRPMSLRGFVALLCNRGKTCAHQRCNCHSAIPHQSMPPMLG
jgi:hypothetical protein